MIKKIALLLAVSLCSTLVAMEIADINPQKLNLSFAVTNDDLPRFQQLLQESPQNINQPMDRWGRPLLHWAVERHAVNIVQWLLTLKRINVNAQSNPGWTALSISVQKARALQHQHREYLNFRIIQMLLAAGADMHIPSITGHSPLDLVHDIDDDDPEKMLLWRLFGQEGRPTRLPEVTTPACPPVAYVEEITRALPLSLVAKKPKRRAAKRSLDSDDDDDSDELPTTIAPKQSKPLPAAATSMPTRTSQRPKKRPAYFYDMLSEEDDEAEVSRIKPRISDWPASRRYCPSTKQQRNAEDIPFPGTRSVVPASELDWAAPEYAAAEKDHTMQIMPSLNKQSPDAVAANLDFAGFEETLAEAVQELDDKLNDEELALVEATE